MAKKAMNFKSADAYKNWVKAAHSIPSKTNPSKSVAAASPGNTPVKIRGKAKTNIQHTSTKKK
jgi:hypothetical protein